VTPLCVRIMARDAYGRCGFPGLHRPTRDGADARWGRRAMGPTRDGADVVEGAGGRFGRRGVEERRVEVDGGVDVVITMGCGDECPFHPGKRSEDWEALIAALTS
jgi:hypothetical protein